MLTLVRKDGFRVVIYSHDHLPPHVHVLKQSAEIRIELNQLGSPTAVPNSKIPEPETLGFSSY